MSPAEACETPLRDLLAAIPADAGLVYEHSPTEHSFIPVGRLAAQAVSELDALRARCEAAEADAALYRRLRTVANSPMLVPRVKFRDNWPSLDALYAVIDAHLKGAGRE